MRYPPEGEIIVSRDSPAYNRVRKLSDQQRIVDTMLAPSVFVFEQKPRWGPELKRQFLGSEFPVRVTGSLEQAPALITASPGSLFVIDSRAGVSQCLRFVVRVWQAASPVGTLIIGSDQVNGLEWVARELGTDHFVGETVSGDELARLCRRFLTRRIPAVHEAATSSVSREK